MKTTILKCLLTLAVACAAAFPSMAAPSRRIIVQVPFAFVAGSVRLPAGEYSVAQGNSERAVFVTNLRTGAAVVMLSETNMAGTGDDRTSVNFVRTGNEYFMKVIRIAGGQGFLMHSAH